MEYGSNRSKRGWIYATFVAILLTCAFWAVDQRSYQKSPESVRAPRTTQHRASSTLLTGQIVTQAAPLEANESSVSREEVSWPTYRAQPVSSLHANIEPSAVVRLAAPRVHPDQMASYTIAEAVKPSDPRNRHESTEFRPVMVSRSIDDPEYRDSFPTTATARLLGSSVWPSPVALIRGLESLIHSVDKRNDPVSLWCTSVMTELDAISRLPKLADIHAEAHLLTLDSLANQVLEESKSTTPRSENQTIQTRLAHSLQRRLAVWNSIWKCVHPQSTHLVSVRSRPIDLRRMARDVEQVRQLIPKTGDTEGWNRYLALADVQQLSQSEQVDPARATETARTFLCVSWQRLNESQRAFLALEPIRNLAEDLHPLALSPIDYRQLMIDLETLEEDPLHRCRASLADAIQTLRFAEQPQQILLADVINTHYRNANLRVAVSGKLIERLLPKDQVVERPVRQRILEADTRGASQIHTRLGIELIPDSSAWNIHLNLVGNVESNTRSNRGPATFHNVGHASVTTARHIRMDHNGIQIKSQTAHVDSHDTLRGFDTDFDSLPVLGDLVRLVVRQQFDQKRGLAQGIVRRAIAEQTDAEFDKRLHHQVDDAEKQITKRLIGPLEKLDLNPLVVDLQTTEERLIARYRVANADQMAAHTPRPRAPSDSHLSIQIHQSAINNAIQQIGLGDRDWTLQELRDKMALAFDQESTPLPENAPQDVSIRFASHRPLSVEFNDGKMWLTLRIAELHQAKGIHFERFMIRTSYTPKASGLNAELAWDEAVSVIGQSFGMLERGKLQAIFVKIFYSRPSIPMISQSLIIDPRVKGLAVSQLEIRDGWLAAAVSTEQSPHVARLQENLYLNR